MTTGCVWLMLQHQQNDVVMDLERRRGLAQAIGDILWQPGAG